MAFSEEMFLLHEMAELMLIWFSGRWRIAEILLKLPNFRANSGGSRK